MFKVSLAWRQTRLLSVWDDNLHRCDQMLGEKVTLLFAKISQWQQNQLTL